jgi:hypothetical protein
MANRHSSLGFSVLAALLLVSVVYAKSSNMQPKQHTWLLGRERISPPVQADPASGTGRSSLVPYLNYPQRVPQMTRWRRMSYVLRWLHLPCTQGMSLTPGMHW